MAQKIYIVRHGETDWNKSRKFQGQSDVPLNDEGRHQAEKLALYLADVLPFDRIVSSDLARAVETAEILNRGYGTPIRGDGGFREMDFGEWEGLDMKAIEEGWPGALEEWFTQGRLNVPGGETQEQLSDRVWRRFQYWADRKDYQKMAIVCHGGVSGALISRVLGKPPEEMSKYMLTNTGICLIHAGGPEGYSLEYLGELLR